MNSLNDVLGWVDAARRAAQRDDAVEIIAVSKTRPAAAIEPVLNAGHRLFGENRVQEAMDKWPALRARYPDARLHLIGSLQTNKARDAIALFDRIESIDRPSLVDALSKRAQVGDAIPSLLVQVNLGEEPQKGGVMPADVDAFVAWATGDKGLRFDGVMGIPPADDDPAPYFALLREIRMRLGLPVLSMGMSGDFETAIAFGATHVRVGTAIFGARS